MISSAGNSLTVTTPFIEEEEDWFASYEDNESGTEITMDELLRGTNSNDMFDVYELEKWISMWKTFLEWDLNKSVVWALNKKIESWAEVESILANLDTIREEDEELFAKLFTSNFVSCLLMEISPVLSYQGPQKAQIEKQIKSLALWIQNHKVEEFSQDDFWNVLNAVGRTQFQFSRLSHTQMEYSRLWRVCCLKPIYLSLKDTMQQSIYFDQIPTPYQVRAGRVEELENLLAFCDGVVDHPKDANEVIAFIELGQKELLYRALKKNVICKHDAKRGIKYAQEHKAYDLIPMLMLKSYGEWPEPKKE